MNDVSTMFFQASNAMSIYKSESPDVETPGLLVKALISSFFMYSVVGPRTSQKSTIANIAGKKHTNKGYRYYFPVFFYFFSASIFSISSLTKAISC